jgi:hypothetical protein
MNKPGVRKKTTTNKNGFPLLTTGNMLDQLLASSKIHTSKSLSRQVMMINVVYWLRVVPPLLAIGSAATTLSCVASNSDVSAEREKFQQPSFRPLREVRGGRRESRKKGIPIYPI